MPSRRAASTAVSANKLLVLVDGRSIYSPLFSGVVWELDPVPLEDIERIEIIRGAGAVMWGANAVNGVINIITRHSRNQAGGAVSVGAGTRGQATCMPALAGPTIPDRAGNSRPKGGTRNPRSNTPIARIPTTG